MDDVLYIHNFLDRLTDEERSTLKHNLDAEVEFSCPDHAIPRSGVG